MSRPSLAWLALAAAIAVATVALFTWQLVSLIRDVTPSRARVECPGTATVDLPAPGTYGVFFEPRSVLGDRAFFSTGGPGDFDYSIVPPGRQQPLAMRPGGTFRYASRSAEGFAIFRFTTDRPGPHVVTVTRADAGSRTGVIAIGDAVDPLRFGLRIAGLVLVMVIGLHAAVILAVLVLVKRFSGSPAARR